MSRPRKFRKVCCLPKYKEFIPRGIVQDDDTNIVLSVDEYETIRLIDNEGFSQEECASYMKVARTTIQQIYTQARKKIAYSIVNGKPLRIEGGDYILCDGKEDYCGCGGCYRHRHNQILLNKIVKDDNK